MKTRNSIRRNKSKFKIIRRKGKLIYIERNGGSIEGRKSIDELV